MRRRDLHQCKSCGRHKPQKDFLLEFNPVGSHYSCTACLAVDKVYCPIHLSLHTRSEMAEMKFKVGSFCNVQNINPTKETVKEAIVTKNPNEPIKELLELIADRLKPISQISELSDRISNLENAFTPMIQSFNAFMLYEGNPKTAEENEILKLELSRVNKDLAESQELLGFQDSELSDTRKELAKVKEDLEQTQNALKDLTESTESTMSLVAQFISSEK